MRRGTVIMSAAALVLGAATAFAQPANFAGHWVVQVLAGAPRGTDFGTAPPPGGGGPGGPGGGRGPNANNTSNFSNDFTVTQDAKIISMVHIDPNAANDTIKVVYNLDGSESKNPGSGFIGTPAEIVSTAKWEKKNLIITTPSDQGPNITTMWMNGKQLWIQTERPGFNGGPGTSTLTIYNKKK